MAIELVFSLATNAPHSEKTPLHVYCADCAHAWICAYLPMTIRKVAPLMKAPCPMCGGKRVYPGLRPCGA